MAVKIEDVVDRESLEAYLKALPDSEQLQVGMRAAFRAAARVLPILAGGFSKLKADAYINEELVSIFASLAIADFRLLKPTAEIMPPRYYKYSKEAEAYVVSAVTAAGIGSRAQSVAAVSRAATAAFRAHSIDIWPFVRDDLEKHTNRLWPDDAPKKLLADWAKAKIFLQGIPNDWSFWVRWYERVLSGRDTHAGAIGSVLEKIDRMDWEKGPGHINPMFDEILAIYRAEDQIEAEGEHDFPAAHLSVLSSQIEQAIERTPNAESIEVNPQTGLLRSVPVSLLAEDVASYAVRKIERAISIFDGDKANQLSAINPELQLLRCALAEVPLHPIELFDACASTANRVRMRCDGGELPEPHQEPLLADFLTQVRNAAADIFANDDRTKQMVSARNEVLGNDALIDARKEVLEGVAEIKHAAEGILSVDLEQDAAIATNPQSDPEERKNSGYRLVSRVARITSIVIGGSVAFAASVAALADSPAALALAKAVLRYLGLL